MLPVSLSSFSLRLVSLFPANYEKEKEKEKAKASDHRAEVSVHVHEHNQLSYILHVYNVILYCHEVDNYYHRPEAMSIWWPASFVDRSLVH